MVAWSRSFCEEKPQPAARDLSFLRLVADEEVAPDPKDCGRRVFALPLGLDPLAKLPVAVGEEEHPLAGRRLSIGKRPLVAATVLEFPLARGKDALSPASNVPAGAAVGEVGSVSALLSSRPCALVPIAVGVLERSVPLAQTLLPVPCSMKQTSLAVIERRSPKYMS